MSEVDHKAPCPKCREGGGDRSGDNLIVYTEGGSHCFACGHHTSAEGTEGAPKVARDWTPESYSPSPLHKRKITQTTCAKYSYGLSPSNKHVACYFKDGKMVGQKIRGANKKFTTLGNLGNALFGSQLWRAGNKRIVITEGELDCLALSQAQGNKWAVVSIPHGAQSAAKAVKANLEYLESFEKVILMFDMDEPGRKAAAACSPLFSPGKCSIAELPLKDAGAMLEAGRVQELINASWQAREYRPDGIVNGRDMWAEVEREVSYGLSYPWESLTRFTYGIRPQEVVAFGAGTGAGKSDIFKEIALHIVTKHKQKVGLIFLEESNADTVTHLVGKSVDKTFHIPDKSYTTAEKKEAFDSVMSSGLVELYDHFGTTDYEAVEAKMRFMVRGLGCKHIFLDHITALGDGAGTSENTNQLMRNIVSSLAQLTRELDFTLFLVSHLRKAQGAPHEEGGRVHADDMLGASALKQWASFIIGLERNQLAEDARERKTSLMRILKDRYTGRHNGKTFELLYDSETGRQREYGCSFTEEEGGEY